MSLPYAVLGEYTGSIQSGSFLDVQDTNLFYTSQSSDIWFGISENDVIELGVYTTDDQTLLNWGVLYQNKSFQTIGLSYINDVNEIVNYSYNELIPTFTLYKNQSILLQPYSDLNTIGVNTGSYVISYNLSREMAGNPSASLSIKEISPTRTEVKLIPVGEPDVEYNSFYLKKFPIRDVAPILLSICKNISYDTIYSMMSNLNQYKNGISFLQFAFFLQDDASVIQFLRNVYEDYISYSSTTSAIGIQSTSITRIQGIRTDYTNYLLQNYDSIADFNDIQTQFIGFVSNRLDIAFNQLSGSSNQGYLDARQFCSDFFIQYFYESVVDPLQSDYQTKYFGYFKNVLNFGNNEYYFMLDHGYIDERQSPTDPMTLVVKLASALPSDISIKDNCWVSNFGMAPFTFNAVLQNPSQYKTYTISPPNFGTPNKLINKENSNILYSSSDLENPSDVANSIHVNKQISELNIDYSDFYNFTVFSSISTRLNIFKNKMVQWTVLSSSLSELNNRYNLSLSSSTIYPYYSTEQSNFTNQVSTLVKSFDGYESYLFNQGTYQYNLGSNSFYSASYVTSQDSLAQEYDARNRDSLLNNAPQYIINDTNYNDYITFLNMVGHHFDNIYTYIAALPIERQVKNELSSSLPNNTLKEMLYSFGWDVDDIIGSLDVNQVYLNSMNSSSYNVLSGQQRLQTIWNRILVTLPGIYKTKGTIECVNYLMACYGLPSSLITIREYGGTDFADDTSPTYELDEKTYMMDFSGVGDYVEGPIPSSTQTVEFKFAVNTNIDSDYYPNFKYFPLFTSIPYPYNSSQYSNYSIGIYKVPGQFDGKVVFQMGSGSSGNMITSSVLPIFNGEIFSVMLRQNDPFDLFETTTDQSFVPLQYDLVVQRNDNVREIFYSSSSLILYENDNNVFSQFGRFRLSNGTFNGTLDKLSIWNVAINDSDFQEHVNDINSYGYSGSLAYQNLWVRLSWDYPQNLYSISSSAVWIDNQSSHYAIPNYYTDATLTTVNPFLYSASLEIAEQNWQTYYPTGSIDILAYNFPEAIGSAFSASFLPAPVCQWVSQSVYPYHFEELTYQQYMDASKYGPNKYKNIKIRTIDYDVQTRFDVKNRSTSESDLTISGESNQLGFFIDPQDSKNKDIIRYVGRSGVMDLIGDPGNLYSDKYYDLINKNYEYNNSGEKRTYFNELLTVYKFYFDKSIFQAIKNVIPARANAYTGVVIEPTIIERPKYQNRPITSSACITYQSAGTAVVKDFYKFSEQLLWADFKTDFSLVNQGYPQSQLTMQNSQPASYKKVIDLSYISDPIRDWPRNLVTTGTNGYIAPMDEIQHGFFPDFEHLSRNWEITSSGVTPSFTVPIIGSVTHEHQNDRFIIGPDEGVNYSQNFYSGINKGNHQILYYMVKVWDKYYYYARNGAYRRTDNPLDNSYDSCSVSLYKYIIVNEYYMRNLIYFTNLVSEPMYDSSSYSYTYNSTTNTYLHKANTFLGTPDQLVSNVSASANSQTPNAKIIFDLNLRTPSQYFELAGGYPRNHYTHKMQQFSKTKYPSFINGIFIKGQQTSNSTVNTDGINDGSLPIQSSATSNLNVVNGSNIIQNIASSTTGQVIPTMTTINAQ